MRTAPMSFSVSRMIHIWKATVTNKWTNLETNPSKNNHNSLTTWYLLKTMVPIKNSQLGNEQRHWVQFISAQQLQTCLKRTRYILNTEEEWKLWGRWQSCQPACVLHWAGPEKHSSTNHQNRIRRHNFQLQSLTCQSIAWKKKGLPWKIAHILCCPVKLNVPSNLLCKQCKQ